MKEVLCKINKKIVLAAFVAIFCLSVGTSIQTVLVLHKGDTTYSSSSFQIYINLFISILSVFLIVPLFTFKGKDLDHYSHSFLASIGFMTLLVILITLGFSPYVVDSMAKVNPKTHINEIWLFVIFSDVSLALGILETYLIYNMIFQKRIYTSMILSFLGLLLKVFFIVLFISGVSPFHFKIWYITFATFVSAVLGVVVLLWFYIRDNKNHKLPLNIKKALEFYKRGFLPGIEKAIGTGFYMLLTLNVINKHTDEWRAWSLADTIILWGIMSITLVLRYSLYYETVSTQDMKHLNKVQNYYLLLSLGIFVIMTILFAEILSFVNLSWKALAIKTLFAMTPFMFLEEVKKQYEIRLINKRTFYFILFNTILDALFIKMPLFFLNKYNIVHLTFWTNYALWAGGITFVVTLTTIQFHWIKNKQEVKPIFTPLLLNFYHKLIEAKKH